MTPGNPLTAAAIGTVDLVEEIDGKLAAFRVALNIPGTEGTFTFKVPREDAPHIGQVVSIMWERKS